LRGSAAAAVGATTVVPPSGRSAGTSDEAEAAAFTVAMSAGRGGSIGIGPPGSLLEIEAVAAVRR
jgi:hypothetical protein